MLTDASPSTPLMAIPDRAESATLTDPLDDKIDAGLFRAGDLLVVPIGAKLPPIYVKSNEPTDVYLRRQFRWHAPHFYLALLPICGILPWIFRWSPEAILGRLLLATLPYAIIAYFVSTTATVDLPLSENARLKRTAAIFFGWMMLLTSLAMVIGGIVSGSSSYDRRTSATAGIIVFVGMLLLIGSLFLPLLIGRMVVRPKRITDKYVWLGGVNREYLKGLPDFATESGFTDR